MFRDSSINILVNPKEVRNTFSVFSYRERAYETKLKKIQFLKSRQHYFKRNDELHFVRNTALR